MRLPLDLLPLSAGFLSVTEAAGVPDIAHASFWFQFSQIVMSVLGVFLIIGIGAFCRSRHWLTREADLSAAKITANVLIPALFLDVILNDPTLDSLWTAWVPPLFGFGFTAGGLILALWMARTIGPWFGLKTDLQQRAFAICAGITNYGYIPLPLCEIFYPGAMVELVLHNVGVDLALWSIGIAIISGAERGKETKSQSLVMRWMRKVLPALTSAPLIAVVIGLSIRALDWEELIPSSLTKSIEILAGAPIPMGLLLSGAIIIDFLKAADWRGAMPVIGFSIGFRQLLMPVLMLGITGVSLAQTDLKHVMVLQASMSSAVFPIVLTRLYHGDTSTALRVVLATSIAGLFLIPLWMSLGAWWLGV